jgi:RNA 3'-terminal phosphate cyclase (ATP)
MNLLEVDGSFGEGGGQILRSAVAISAILGKGVVIRNIRKGRPKPGLSIQHIKSIELAGKLCDATIDGLVLGSTEVRFTPKAILGGVHKLDIGTAGSITLVLQSVLPIACFASSPVIFEITGGTDVKWSPPYDYFKSVTLPALRLFGLEMTSTLIRRGFFPRGDGKAIVTLEPSGIHGADICQPPEGKIMGVSASSRLPHHVTERQANAAKEYLIAKGLDVGDIGIDVREELSTGSSITLYRGFLGASALGERGIPAEKVGQLAAKNLYEEIITGAAVDEHLADQLIIFMGLAKGNSKVLASSISSHTSTNICVVEQMLGKKFKIIKNKCSLILCE